MEVCLEKSDLIFSNENCYQFEICLLENKNIVIKITNYSTKTVYSDTFGLKNLKEKCALFSNKNSLQEIYEKILNKIEMKEFDLIEVEKNDKTNKSQVSLDFILRYKLDDEEVKSIIKLPLYLKKKFEILPIEKLVIRSAKEEDIELVISFIKELAEYEREPEGVTIDHQTFKECLFGSQKYIECLLAYIDEIPVGFAVYFLSFSTWVGKTLYLDDLYIKPDWRSKGLGKTFFAYLADYAYKNNCQRFEWICLDWNEPSIKFYKSLNAIPMDDWTKYRLAGKNIHLLGQHNKITI